LNKISIVEELNLIIVGLMKKKKKNP